MSPDFYIGRLDFGRDDFRATWLVTMEVNEHQRLPFRVLAEVKRISEKLNGDLISSNVTGYESFKGFAAAATIHIGLGSIERFSTK